MHEVWVIRKQKADGNYSFYACMFGMTPDWVDNIENAKHFTTEQKAQKAFSEVGIYALGSEILKVKVNTI